MLHLNTHDWFELLSVEQLPLISLLRMRTRIPLSSKHMAPKSKKATGSTAPSCKLLEDSSFSRSLWEVRVMGKLFISLQLRPLRPRLMP